MDTIRMADLGHIRRVAHCNEGHRKVLDMTGNCPPHFFPIPYLAPTIKTFEGCVALPHSHPGWTVIGRRDGFAMILMPLVMLLPVIGLPVFWILPFGEALPTYLFLVSFFAGMMWVMRRTMKYPRMTGSEPMMGKTAEVVSRTSLGYGPSYMVRVLGELWSADSEEILQIGETVRIVSVQGNRLFVKRKK